MKIQELFHNDGNSLSNECSSLIRAHCDEFLDLTSDPLLKYLPEKDETFLKVKVRFHKRKSDMVDIFNEALYSKYQIMNIHQRAIFANGESSFDDTGTNSYYIFPINGFKFMYSEEVTNSRQQFKDTFDSLRENSAALDGKASEMVKDLMIYTYVSTDLNKGIVEGSEIIIYNIPYYFAISRDGFPDYEQLKKHIWRV
jgi:hypothetical protein